MVPNPAETASSAPVGSALCLPPRLLWQAPVFVLGLVALAGVCIARPPWRPIDAHRAERELLAARKLHDRPDAGREPLQIAIERLEEHQEKLPGRAAEFRFLIGSLYLRLAGGGSPGEALEAARKARQHLEEAQALGVPEADQPRLLYRLGKALALAHADPKQVLDLLSRSVERGADDPFEGHGLLAQAYLRLPVPDLPGALLANEKQLQLPLTDEKLLAPVRLLRGELLLRLNRPEEARRVLAYIGPTAPAAPQAQARFLRARSLQEEQRWEEAAALWKEIVDDTRLPPREPGWTLYFLGVCYRQLDLPEEAVRVWEQCARRVDGGDEAVAAALGLAELQLLDNSPDALEGFERAVRGIESPDEWRNTLVDLEKARVLFERGCEAYRETADAESGVRLAKLYERLALPGVAPLLRARAADAGASVKRGEEARALYRQAGEAYEQSAGQAPDPGEQLERLWLSADRYRQGQDHPRTAAVLQRVLPLVQDRQRRGEGWFVLGEAQRELKNQPAARAAYHECLGYQTPFAYRARYQLALLELAQNNTDEAVAMLDCNLNQLSTDPDPEAEEKSLLALADVLFQRGKYHEAQPRLEQMLRSYPEAAGAVKAHFQLAECHREQGKEVGERFKALGPGHTEAHDHYLKEFQRRMEEAAQHYGVVFAALAKREPSSLTAEEQSQLRIASFGEADAWREHGKYNQKALELFEQLASRYAGRVEEVYALDGAATTHFREAEMALSPDSHLDPAAKARLRDSHRNLARTKLERGLKALEALPEAAFQGERLSRSQWEGWLTKRIRAAQPPPAVPPPGASAPRTP